MKSKLVQRLNILWEIPFAIVSFLFFKAFKRYVTALLKLAVKKGKTAEEAWMIVDEQSLNLPRVLTFFQLYAPRWNTHAVIAVSNVAVKHELKICTETAKKSAHPWSIVITDESKNCIVLGSFGNDCNFPITEQDGWQTISLPPGRYNLGLRYYNVLDGAMLPKVVLDGERELASRQVLKTTNDFYKHLAERGTFGYKMMHFYVYVMLRLRFFFPDKFIRDEYLPVGNPETYFLYGALYAGERLKVTADPGLFETHNVYFNVYDRASLPVHWGQIGDTETLTPSVIKKGYYLIRVCQKTTFDSTTRPPISVRAI